VRVFFVAVGPLLECLSWDEDLVCFGVIAVCYPLGFVAVCICVCVLCRYSPFFLVIKPLRFLVLCPC